jgi:hypothetical protein
LKGELAKELNTARVNEEDYLDEIDNQDVKLTDEIILDKEEVTAGNGRTHVTSFFPSTKN